MASQHAKINKEISGQGIYNPLSKRLFTLKEAADYLGRSVWSMRELIWSGTIPVVKPDRGRKIYVDIVDLDSFITKNKSVYQ
jgi:excisionase family DNA binding protein